MNPSVQVHLHEPISTSPLTWVHKYEFINASPSVQAHLHESISTNPLMWGHLYELIYMSPLIQIYLICPIMKLILCFNIYSMSDQLYKNIYFFNMSPHKWVYQYEPIRTSPSTWAHLHEPIYMSPSTWVYQYEPISTSLSTWVYQYEPIYMSSLIQIYLIYPIMRLKLCFNIYFSKSPPTWVHVSPSVQVHLHESISTSPLTWAQ